MPTRPLLFSADVIRPTTIFCVVAFRAWSLFWNFSSGLLPVLQNSSDFRDDCYYCYSMSSIIVVILLQHIWILCTQRKCTFHPTIYFYVLASYMLPYYLMFSQIASSPSSNTGYYYVWPTSQVKAATHQCCFISSRTMSMFSIFLVFLCYLLCVRGSRSLSPPIFILLVAVWNSIMSNIWRQTEYYLVVLLGLSNIYSWWELRE